MSVSCKASTNASYSFLFCLWLSTGQAFVVAEDRNFADELPRTPSRSPEAGLKSIETVAGYRVDLIAAEPLVTDPVAMSFDADGRLYVVEMRDYSEQDKERLGRVRLLEDVDDDGVFDKATVFADELSWPTAIIAFDGGVFVGAPPLMLWLKDTNGDLRADEHRVVYEGFNRSNVQGLMNSLRWGIDNRIHGATGTAGGQIVRPDVEGMTPVDLRGRDFSFDPRSLDVRAETGGAQHGMCFDDWGRKFCCSNSDHLQFVMYDQRYAARFPEVNAVRARRSIAADGPQAAVFRRSPIEPWRIVRTRLRVAGEVPGPVEGGGRPAGYFTGATGTTIYRGDAMPSERGRAFIADVGSNLVHRKEISFEELEPIGRRIDEASEFLTSDDVWFRPVQFANAPDGGLHILDMSRETIEHPKSLPEMIKKHLDLTSGRDQGRLYRVVPQTYVHRRTPRVSRMSSGDLVSLLEHANAWHRETASRLLFERQDLQVVSELVSLIAESKSPFARIQSLSVLSGLGELSEEVIQTALLDGHGRVREFAVRLSERFPESEGLCLTLGSMVDDDDPHVRFQLAFTIGVFPLQWRVPIAARLLTRDGDNSWIRFATLTSLSTGAGQVLTEMLKTNSEPSYDAALKALAELVGRQAREEEVARVLKALVTSGSDHPGADAVLEHLARGLADSRNPRASVLASDDALVKRLADLLSSARGTVVDDGQSASVRSAAVRTIGMGATLEDVELLLSLLRARVPSDVQLAAVETLGRLNFEIIGGELIQRWPNLGPKLRKEAFQTLLARSLWTDLLLSAIESGQLARSDWDAGRLKLHRLATDSKTRKRIDAILAKSETGTRADVVAKYRVAINMPGEVEAGRRVFLKSCAACHRIGKEGFAVGPNLVTAFSRGRESILVNVLDPNREVNPEYISYIVLTDNGRTHTGMIAEQSATGLTLRRGENREETVRRATVELMQSSGQSLMPEGLERDITVREMADLFAFLDDAR